MPDAEALPFRDGHATRLHAENHRNDPQEALATPSMPSEMCIGRVSMYGTATKGLVGRAAMLLSMSS